MIDKSSPSLANHLKSGCLVVSVIAGSLAAIPLSAADLDAEQKSQQSSSAAAKRAFIDPETGEIRAPTPAERQALQQEIDAEQKRSRQSELTFRPAVNGDGYIVDFRGRFQHSLKVQIGADGSLTYQCEHEHVARDSED
jgi:hypothetical protein